jgi:hypothetical protein
MIPVAIAMAGAEMFHLAASAEPIYPPTPTAITPIPKARKAIPRNLACQGIASAEQKDPEVSGAPAL